MYFGDRSFNYFDGMWSLAIYDTESKNITLSRDYVGQKPLYYAKNNNYYIFNLPTRKNEICSFKMLHYK